ncbi:MAG: hypothetical protein KJ049_13670 [Gammaproteobacteria bacterium]|jgi:hypothetical protein|nr:hypothetical protein [Gammaproteobacteria bacterium]
MWSNGFSFGLRLERHWCLTGGVVAVTLAALLSIRLSGLPLAAAILAGLIACLQAGHALFASHPVAAFSVDTTGRISAGDGGAGELRLKGRPWILPGIAAGFRLAGDDGRITSAIVFRMPLDADTWRRLLVRLRRI